MNIGKIEVTKYEQILEFGKKTKMNQKGMTPIFNHK